MRKRAQGLQYLTAARRVERPEPRRRAEHHAAAHPAWLSRVRQPTERRRQRLALPSDGGRVARRRPLPCFSHRHARRVRHQSVQLPLPGAGVDDESARALRRRSVGDCGGGVRRHGCAGHCGGKARGPSGSVRLNETGAPTQQGTHEPLVAVGSRVGQGREVAREGNVAQHEREPLATRVCEGR